MKKILIADDSALLRKNECDIISSGTEKYEISTCRDGDEVLDIYEKISPDMLRSILIALEGFEKSTKCTAKGYSLGMLADDLKTNTRYTSAVILHYRNKKIRQYINDLKIEHLVQLFKEEPIYRSFTYEALGQLVGFGSTQIFTKAFKEKMGKSPIDFINELYQKTSI